MKTTSRRGSNVSGGAGACIYGGLRLGDRVRKEAIDHLRAYPARKVGPPGLV